MPDPYCMCTCVKVKVVCVYVCTHLDGTLALALHFGLMSVFVSVYFSGVVMVC